MRTRIPASTLKRLEALEQKQGKNRPVMMLPRLVYDVDEWEAIAAPMQFRLKENVVEDTAVDYSDLPKLELVSSR
ncbi:hypothetical protein MAH1_20860 [Sessilibacter sp. MAH1]